MSEDIQVGKIYYANSGYTLIVSEIYVDEIGEERVIFNFLGSPDQNYDSRAEVAKEAWTPIKNIDSYGVE